MAIVANTYLTFSAVGNREDLVDTIYNVSPTDTPFQASIGKNKAEATYHEWQTDVLASAAANAQLQGDDTTSSYTFTAVAATKRLGNQTQISRKDAVVSGTQDAVNKAGRKKFLAMREGQHDQQIERVGRELREMMPFLKKAKEAGVPQETGAAAATK